MALACSWGGFAQSDIRFSHFFQDDHTIMIRYLMQYPLGYAGAFFCGSGIGHYFVGQGDYKSLGIDLPEGATGVEIQGKTNILIGVGSFSKNYPAPGRGWHHVALVRKKNQMQLFIDGEARDSFSIPSDNLPNGVLRFGQSPLPLPNEMVGGQFYGLLDDFALFNTDLSAQHVKELADAKRLTDVPSLIEHDSFKAGYVFRNVRPTSVPEKFRRELQLSPAASFQEVSESRNAIVDVSKIPLPLNTHMHLPFAPGEAWRVTQGYNQTASHNGYAAFCWDFTRAGIGGSEGEMIYSATSGRVRQVVDCLSTPTDSWNYVAVIQDHNESCDYLHIKKDSSLVSRGDHVSFGTPLARVGDVGAAEGAYHLHFAISNGEVTAPNLNSTTCTDTVEVGGSNFFTMPAAFSNYEAEINGAWKLVIRGIPQTDQRIRRPADEGPIRYTAVWERSTVPEIQVYGMRYEPYRAKYDSIWDAGWRLALLETVGVDDHARYTAVWRLTGGGEFQLYGATRSEIDAENNKRHRDGWRIDMLTSYVVDGHAHYTGVWRPGDQARPMIMGETFNALNARDRVQRDLGFRLHRLSSHSNGDEARYSAIWRLSNEEEVPFFDQTEHDYRADYGARLDKGYRVKLLSIAVVNGEPKYSGAFVKQANPGDEERWHAVSYGDLRARYDVLWQQGWRLRLLEPYVS